MSKPKHIITIIGGEEEDNEECWDGRITIDYHGQRAFLICGLFKLLKELMNNE